MTNTESVYGWGLNDNSQLGYNGQAFKDTEDAWTDIIVTPTKLPWFTNKEVRRIYANGHASYALLDNVSMGTDSKANGVVYAWGAFGETNSTGKTVYNNLDEPTNKLLHLKISTPWPWVSCT